MEDAERRRQGAAMLAAQLAEHELQRMLEEERLEAVSNVCRDLTLLLPVPHGELLLLQSSLLKLEVF